MPKQIHEYCSRTLESEIYDAASEFPLRKRKGSSRCRYYNLLGCSLTRDSVQEKEPDGGVMLTMQNAGNLMNYVFSYFLWLTSQDETCKNLNDQYYPNFQVEVAHHYEDLFLLLIESAAWLNETTDVQFVFAVKVCPIFSDFYFWHNWYYWY